jgi:hypothetical protein
VKFRLHSEEIAAVVLIFLGIVLPIQHFAKNLKDVSFWVVLAAVAIEFIVFIAAITYFMRNKQRYEKPRSNI